MTKVNVAESTLNEKDARAALELTRQLILCDSYNPPGDEKKAAGLCARLLENAGFKVTIDEFLPARCNVIATYGDPDDIALILDGHLDVVPAFGDTEKCLGEMDDKFIYGRGSSDMLGGCAAIVTAACQAAKKISPRRGLMVLLVADEEDKNRGILYELSKRRFKADAAVIAEPTGLAVQLGNRGFSSFYIRTAGKACHASKPQNGVNAIYRMGPVICALEKYAASLKDKRDPYLGEATSCIGTIKGGIRLNTVPDACEIELERRLLPGEGEAAVKREIEEVVGETGEVVRRTFFPASLISRDDPLVRHCEEAIRETLGTEPVISVFTACTEASMFSVKCGIPTLLLGPGELKYAHVADERCEYRQIIDCTNVFVRLIEKYIR